MSGGRVAMVDGVWSEVMTNGPVEARFWRSRDTRVAAFPQDLVIVQIHAHRNSEVQESG